MDFITFFFKLKKEIKVEFLTIVLEFYFFFF